MPTATQTTNASSDGADAASGAATRSTSPIATPASA